MALVDVKVPDIGDFKEVAVIELLVRPGDMVKAEQSLITVESDKASMEIPSSHAGVVKALRVAVGDKVSEGSVLLSLETADAASAPLAAAAPPAALAAAAPSPDQGTVTSPSDVEILVPNIGDFDEVAVIELLVKPGDTVRAEQSLITVESDKASMEIPSSHAGRVKQLRVALGDKVSKGSPIAVIEAVAAAGGASASAGLVPPASRGALAASTAVAPAGAPEVGSAPVIERVAPTAALAPHAPAELKGPLPHASPSIRRQARELGVPLEEVQGSGPHGRITHDDVSGFVQRVLSGAAQTAAQKAKAPAPVPQAGILAGLLPWPQVDFAKFGPVQRKDLGRIKKISGANLHRNWVVIPHVTNHDDADITDLEAFRLQLNKEYDKAGVKITMLAFLVKACVAALKKFPDFNASLDGDQLVLKQYFHIGFAADTPNGLMVPVIKDADQKGIVAIAREMNELAARARDGKLSPAEMSGGCLSISSLGGIGGRYFTPIINAPEVAILGVCKSGLEPKWDGKAFVPRLMLPLSLSWDHRVIDGASAARFNSYLGQVLADFRRVML